MLYYALWSIMPGRRSGDECRQCGRTDRDEQREEERKRERGCETAIIRRSIYVESHADFEKFGKQCEAGNVPAERWCNSLIDCVKTSASSMETCLVCPYSPSSNFAKLSGVKAWAEIAISMCVTRCRQQISGSTTLTYPPPS